MRAFCLTSIFLGTLWGTLNAAAQDDDRKYLLERVDDMAVVQLYIDGFDQLPLNQKQLIYHLSQAAVAGRDIFIDQKYKHSLAIRDLIEETITHAEGIDEAVLAKIRRYAKLFWGNNGPHNPITSQKNVLTCSPQEFTRAVKQAESNGAKLPKVAGESTEQLLERMEQILFDPEFESHVTQKSPSDGRDILIASANNLYEGVTTKDLDGFSEKYALNSRLLKTADGQLVEQVYRAGFDNVLPPGMYAAQLGEIIEHLEAAIPHATPKMARALGALVHYYRTGESIDFREYNIAWVADTDSPVDTINGFIEVYVDARGQKGSWEGIVYYNDPEKTEMIRKFADEAQWFEDHMPYGRQFRKPEVRGISAKAIQVVMETGDSGPVTPIGINLPNPRDIREQYGSKSVSLSNVIEAYDQSRSPAARREFVYDDEELARVDLMKIALALEVNMHEVIGHASGQMAPNLDVNPEDVIKEYYSALEEGRADLVALWFLGDPKLVELGLCSEENRKVIQQAAYEAYTRNAMTQLRRIKLGTTIEEDHMRNRQMIVNWLMANTEAIEKTKRDGKTYLRVKDVEAWHVGVGRLLREVQRIKSEADRPAAQELFETYGIHIDTDLRDEVLQRYEQLDQPSYTAFVMPKLTTLRNDQGAITDVTVSYPMDIEAQMLEWSGRR
jgi:dipeptidyl-peptidase-3